MQQIRAIIFDCDGVLVDSEPISNRVLIEMAKAYGADIALDYAYTHFKGNSLKSCIKLISELVPIPSENEFEVEFRARSFEAFKNEIQPVKNVKQLLSQLEVPYCVASSGPQYKIELNLELTGLSQYFEDRIYSCYTINKWKPEPDIFLWAADELNVEPKECLVIEDSIYGVEAALKGGFMVCGFDPDGKDQELKKAAHFTIDHMLKLLDYLMI